MPIGTQPPVRLLMIKLKWDLDEHKDKHLYLSSLVLLDVVGVFYYNLCVWDGIGMGLSMCFLSVLACLYASGTPPCGLIVS